MSDSSSTNEMDSLASDQEVVRRYLDRAEAPEQLPEAERSQLESQIRELMRIKNARLVAHYYTESGLQDLAEDSGGFVGDSLEMARFGRDCDADILMVAGVRFMGESAKILSPHKQVLMPTLEATCSLDIACPIEDFAPFCDEHSDRTVVVYANTSAAVKARSDWVVTSSIALDVVEHLMERYDRKVFGLAATYVQSADDAKDIFQEEVDDGCRKGTQCRRKKNSQN